MRYIKLFEELNIGNPKVGDYVLMKSNSNSGNRYLQSFIDNSIGQLETVDIYNGYRCGRYSCDDVTRYTVTYENIPEQIKDYFNGSTRIFDISWIFKK
jgi:hypothetical protein